MAVRCADVIIADNKGIQTYVSETYHRSSELIAYGGDHVMRNVPEAKQALDQFKMQAASEVGVNLNNGYNGDITSKQAGSVGGQMVKKMIESYEKNMK